MKQLSILIALSFLFIFASCSKDKDLDPLAEYYGTYLASESLSDETWTATFSAGEAPGEILVVDALSEVDKIDLVAMVDGSNFSFSQQPILESSFISGTGTIVDGEVSCRMTITIGLIKIFYTMTYEKL